MFQQKKSIYNVLYEIAISLAFQTKTGGADLIMGLRIVSGYTPVIWDKFGCRRRWR